MTTDPLAVARWLCQQRGCSVIPIDHPLETTQTDPTRVGKVPRLSMWKIFQEVPPTDDNLRVWFGNGHPRNVGLVTGAVSRLVVVDCDSPEAQAWADTHLPHTEWMTRTSKGDHRGYRHPGVPVSNKTRIKTGDAAIEIDVRGDGGYVVAPGSLHQTGVLYTRIGSWPPIEDLPMFDPAWLGLDAAAAEPRQAETTLFADDAPLAPDLDEGVRMRVRAYLAETPPAIAGQGGDAHTFTVACRLVRGFTLPDADALTYLREWNQRCVPPWTDRELATKIANARKYGEEPLGGRRADPRYTGQSADTETGTPEGASSSQTPASADFIRSKKGHICTFAIENVRRAIAQLDMAPTYDEFRRVICLAGDPITDDAVEQLWVRIDDTFHWRPNRALLRSVLITDALRHPHHPVRHYLDALVWDKIPRLDRWLITYAGAKETNYVKAVGPLPLLAAVRRVRQPGAKFDELLVLESPQGTGKSSALLGLCPCAAWFSNDLPLGVDSKETIERTAGRWLIEAAELHGNRGREAEQLKAFLSRQEDGPVRMAYGRFAVSVPRQFVQIGTTNVLAGYLKDTTGSRRFWPVRITRFDVPALTADRDQLWAEAAAREAAGASIRLTETLWQAAAEEQEARRAIDPWEDVLGPLLGGDGITRVESVTVAAVWDVLGVQANCRDNRHADRVSAILQRYGFTKRRTSTERAWVREETPPPSQE